jgi:hypothetical protein
MFNSPFILPTVHCDGHLRNGRPLKVIFELGKKKLHKIFIVYRDSVTNSELRENGTGINQKPLIRTYQAWQFHILKLQYKFLLTFELSGVGPPPSQL